MGTTDQTFYLPGTSQTDWDGTDPTGGDVRKLRPAVLSETDDTTILSFPTAASSIVFDPYTTRSTTGTGDVNKFGWAVNLNGSDGMEAAADALRLIPAGTWTMNVDMNGVVVGYYTITVSFYRISSNGLTRTLLFTATSGTLVLTAAFTSHQWFSSQPAYTFAPNESVLCSFYVTKTATAVAETVNVRLGAGSSGSRVAVPTPGIRTEYVETVTASADGRATVLDGTKTVTGTVRDSAGAAVSGATVKLFDQSTDTRISTNTSAANGAYTFTRADNDTATYYVVGFSDATHHGTSDRDLTAT